MFFRAEFYLNLPEDAIGGNGAVIFDVILFLCKKPIKMFLTRTAAFDNPGLELFIKSFKIHPGFLLGCSSLLSRGQIRFRLKKQG